MSLTACVEVIQVELIKNYNSTEANVEMYKKNATIVNTISMDMKLTKSGPLLEQFVKTVEEK